MPITSVNPYLHFDGDAEKAIKLYESALGARTEGLMRLADMPGEAPPPEHKDRIIHSELRVGAGSFMVADSMPGQPNAGQNNVDVLLNYDDPAEMARAFDALAAGGKVTLAIHDTFWGAKFGVLVDAFGVTWMFHHQVDKGRMNAG